jgi:Na+/H+ antiporter NhaC
LFFLVVAGSFTIGYRNTLGVYILNSLSDKYHGYVFLFSLFMAGLIGLIEKSGGFAGITHVLQSIVKTSRTAQGASFLSGIIIFFDDYTNCLIAGASMRPLTDACVVSREKLAFIVDATAAPIASIVPISSWIGYEIGLIQTELDNILARYPDSVIGNTTSFNVFLQSVKYRYYCIFMLILIPLQILSGRDFGPMLIAERLTKVYGRTDGGPGRAVLFDGSAKISCNAPKSDTPCRWWNMVIPIMSLLVYIIYLLIWTGQQVAEGGETIYEVIGMGSSYDALVWGTMAAVLTTVAFYFIQDKKDGRITWFNVKGHLTNLVQFISGKVDMNNKERATALVDTREAMSSFLSGMERIFGVLVILTLAWATGAIMGAVGLNRLCSEIITDPELDTRMLPTVTFLIACIIGLASGTSWGTMAILFPLLLVPTYEATMGDDSTIFYGVVAGILAGAVAGDHASPISDTTILSALASECQLMSHVKTQAPYALVVIIWSVLVGTIPLGMSTFPNGVCIFLGLLAMLFHVLFTSEFIINKTGRYDIFTEIYIRFLRNKDFYMILKADVVTSFESGMPLDRPESGAIVGKVTTPYEQSVGVIENNSDDTGIIDSDEPRPMVEIVTIHDEGVM